MDYWGGLLADLGSETNAVSSVVDEALPDVINVPENNQEEIDLIDFYSYHGFGENNTKNTSLEKPEESADDVPYYGYGGYEPTKSEVQIESKEPDLMNMSIYGHKPDDAEGIYAAPIDTFAPNYTPPPPPPTSTHVEEIDPKSLTISPVDPIVIPNRSPKKTSTMSLQQRMALLQSEIESEDKMKSSALYYGGKSTEVSSLQYDSPRELPLRKPLKYIPPMSEKNSSDFESDKKVVSLVYTNDSGSRPPEQEEDDSDVEVMPVDRTSSLEAANQSGGSSVGLVAKTSAGQMVLAQGRFGSGAGAVKQANKAVFAAAEAIAFVKDLAVAQLTTYVESNVYISSFVGCVNESIYYMADRAKTVSDMYINTITSDDPEKRHLNKIKNSTKWQNILLR